MAVVVGPEGVYLAGSGFWYPQIDTELIEFSIQARSPDGWHVISQGAGTSRDGEGVARWTSEGAMDEIYLVGGPLQVFRDSAGTVETLVYLHEKDEAIAAKYLTATAQYLEMYRGLTGPYPYGKFALVENFWPTGYGMPSFTLLGAEIIRFPFIITSSYPHEILHNWWGNSVFVDYQTGNWCEGLTAYLADHLIQEQRGLGDQYRRSTLQKYRDYVRDSRDFPLTEFRSRESAATEAVGYGKTLMGFHMLRRAMGDAAFNQFLARFYREFRGRRASFDDVRKTAEAVAGADYSRFFSDWVTRPGAPVLAAQAAAREAGGRFTVEGTLRQTQDAEPYALSVPIAIQTRDGLVSRDVEFDGSSREARFSIGDLAAPLALRVDPYFDAFRRLDPRETPPSIGQIFGEPRVLALLPSAEGAAALDGYRALFAGWQSDSHQIDVALDSEVTTLPADRGVWLVGRENRLAAAFAKASAGQARGFVLDDRGIALDGQRVDFANHTAVVVLRHPENVEKAVGWIVADPPVALPGLGRKLPHYGKYSYLGFEGDEPVNVLSGQWQASDSPLTVEFGRAGEIPALPPDPAKPLATLPPVFSQKTLADHVATLAAPALEGRGLGSAGLQKAAEYIVQQFKTYGLTPAGDNGTFLQTFTVAEGPDGKPVETFNIVGYVPGTRADWQTQSAVVSAHYDHLGRGWPDVHKGDEGQIHPGADDNASGVAVMLELARLFASGEKPMRNVVFVAFSGEEAGLRGSRYYVEHPAFPLDQVIGAINLDTVGRLGNQPVSVLGTGTATEWQHIFRGAGFVTGVTGRNVPESIQSSDQVPFIERGVPAVQIFTGAHTDYHRPSDTADKIDTAGLVKVATFVKEGVAYLAERPDPLKVTISNAPAAARPAAPAGQGEGRRVSFGTVPDFAFSGPGVRVDGLVDGSPAAAAGLQVGDVILEIDGTAIANLQGFSDRLRTLSAGQTVAVRVQRGAETLTLKVTVVER